MGTEDARKLFVSGLPEGVTDETLRRLFANAGVTVTDLSLPKDRMTGKPRGFAFVTLSTAEQAGQARSTMDGLLLEGRSISVREFSAEPPPRREIGMGGPRRDGPGGGGGAGPPAQDRTLYVGNLPYDANEQEIRDLLATAGEPGTAVDRIHLPIDQDGRKRGFGFVTMANEAAARGVIDVLRAAELRGRRLVLNIAHPKGERPAGGPREGGYAGGGGGFGGGGGGGGFGGGGGGGGFGGGGGGGFPGGGGGGGFPGGGGGFPGGGTGAPAGTDSRRPGKRTVGRDEGGPKPPSREVRPDRRQWGANKKKRDDYDDY